MFHQLDESIAAFVQAELPLEAITVSFARPDEHFPPPGVSLPALSFFLYDVRENLGLRRAEWETERDSSGALLRRRNPSHLKCSYLITAWPDETDLSEPPPAVTEHRMIGEVMRLFMRNRRIPAEYLVGELAGDFGVRNAFVTEKPPLGTGEGQIQGLGEFWQAMGGRPRFALHYAATIGIDIFDPLVLGEPVQQTSFRIIQASGQ